MALILSHYFWTWYWVMKGHALTPLLSRTENSTGVQTKRFLIDHRDGIQDLHCYDPHARSIVNASNFILVIPDDWELLSTTFSESETKCSRSLITLLSTLEQGSSWISMMISNCMYTVTVGGYTKISGPFQSVSSDNHYSHVSIPKPGCLLVQP